MSDDNKVKVFIKRPKKDEEEKQESISSIDYFPDLPEEKPEPPRPPEPPVERPSMPEPEPVPPVEPLPIIDPIEDTALDTSLEVINDNKSDDGDKKRKKKPKKSKDKKKQKKNLTADEAMKAYLRRKRIIYVAFVGILLATTAGIIYREFIKQPLTAEEAAVETNIFNGQSKNQKWDSGVQSFLQRNLPDLLKDKYETINSDDEGVQYKNIVVERNVPCSDDMFLTFFSFDMYNNNKPEKLFCEMFISTKGDEGFRPASEVMITARIPYSKISDTKPVENKFLAFPTDAADIDEEKSAAFKKVLENFLTLGYNSKQDVSNIYKGKTKLDFTGMFKQIESCEVHKTPNLLGFNAVAKYTVEYSNGVVYHDTIYLKVKKDSSGSYIIESIM